MLVRDDLQLVTTHLRKLRQETRRVQQEHGPTSRQATSLEARLQADSARLIPPPGAHAAIRSYLQQLHEDMLAIRETNPGSGLASDAWHLYFNESARLGYSLTSLDEFSPDEGVRFFARVVWGVDGHAYWTGGRIFKNNEGRDRSPRRWWWMHELGLPLPSTVILNADCGEPHCIVPGHCVAGKKGVKRRYKDQDLLGRLQVLALRLGYTPSRADWKKAAGEPGENVYRYYFGNWVNALRQAGLQPRQVYSYTSTECLQAIRFVRHEIGHWPTHDEFFSFREQLQRKGLPTSKDPMIRHYGSWMQAREKAKRGASASSKR